MPPKLSRLGTAALAVAVLATASGCSRIRDHKGYVFDSTLVDTVQPGIDNKDSVAKTLGRPSFVGQFDRGVENWYYVGRDTRQLAFASPRPVAQTTLEVHFDASGNVTGVTKAGLDRVVMLKPHGDKTPTLGRERGFFAELFGNIGRVGGVGGMGGGTADNPQ